MKIQVPNLNLKFKFNVRMRVEISNRNFRMADVSNLNSNERLNLKRLDLRVTKIENKN